jgi:hypothetical protein
MAEARSSPSIWQALRGYLECSIAFYDTLKTVHGVRHENLLGNWRPIGSPAASTETPGSCDAATAYH